MSCDSRSAIGIPNGLSSKTSWAPSCTLLVVSLALNAKPPPLSSTLLFFFFFILLNLLNCEHLPVRNGYTLGVTYDQHHATSSALAVQCCHQAGHKLSAACPSLDYLLLLLDGSSTMPVQPPAALAACSLRGSSVEPSERC